MALIVEVLHPRTGEVRQRFRLERFPARLGRQLDNDLVLDDPYVDAHHAQFVQDPDGTLVLEDLGSLNKLSTIAHARAERVRCAPGAEVRVGRTALRIRDAAGPIAAAIPIGGAADAVAHAWYERPAARVASILGAGALFGLSAWLGTSERDGATVALTAALGFLLLGIIWAGVWAVGGRIVVGQFRFVAHLAIASWMGILSIVLGGATNWVEFLSPDNGIAEGAQGLFLLVASGAMISLHLAEASHLTRARRWRAGASVCALALLIAGAFSLADEDAFTDVPEFSSVIKSAPVGLVPKQSVPEFEAVLADLRAGVDSLLTTKGGAAPLSAP
jgi:hypothetical protein